MNVDIIIPTYKNEGLTIKCLESIKTHTRIPYRIIWIDDCSPLRSFNKVLDFLESLGMPFKHRRLKKNKGFATAVNKGLREANSKYIAILNNDIIVTDGWLGKLVKVLQDSEKIGLIGTVTNKADSICRYNRIAVMGGYEIPCNPEGFFNSLPAQAIPVNSNISYFCVAIKREVIEKIGYLDERFYMGGEDDDYNDRIRQAGYQTVICMNCFIYHNHHATIDLIPNAGELKRQNRKLLYHLRADRALK